MPCTQHEDQQQQHNQQPNLNEQQLIQREHQREQLSRRVSFRSSFNRAFAGLRSSLVQNNQNSLISQHGHSRLRHRHQQIGHVRRLMMPSPASTDQQQLLQQQHEFHIQNQIRQEIQHRLDQRLQLVQQRQRQLHHHQVAQGAVHMVAENAIHDNEEQVDEDNDDLDDDNDEDDDDDDDEDDDQNQNINLNRAPHHLINPVRISVQDIQIRDPPHLDQHHSMHHIYHPRIEDFPALEDLQDLHNIDRHQQQPLIARPRLQDASSINRNNSRAGGGDQSSFHQANNRPAYRLYQMIRDQDSGPQPSDNMSRFQEAPSADPRAGAAQQITQSIHQQQDLTGTQSVERVSQEQSVSSASLSHPSPASDPFWLASTSSVRPQCEDTSIPASRQPNVNTQHLPLLNTATRITSFRATPTTTSSSPTNSPGPRKTSGADNCVGTGRIPRSIDTSRAGRLLADSEGPVEATASSCHDDEFQGRQADIGVSSSVIPHTGSPQSSAPNSPSDSTDESVTISKGAKGHDEDYYQKRLCIFDSMPIFTHHRQAGVIKNCLYNGSSFTGYQRSKNDSYEVNVRIQHVDYKHSTLCGYLCINHLTKAHPSLTTFFEGEIISKEYPFLTKRWDADRQIDLAHWSKFEEFADKYTHNFASESFDYDQLAKSDNIYMRWKEHFLVPDHTIEHVEGASYAGFYYICYNKRANNISGYYFHVNSENFESFQSLNLELDYKGSTDVYEFR